MRRARVTGNSGFILRVHLDADGADFGRYPLSIPSISALDQLTLDPKVTFLVGENGSGKSTLIEAIAAVCGFNPEGGSKNFNFRTHDGSADLYAFIRIARAAYRESDGFFLRAESLFNVASEIERNNAEYPGLLGAYGGRSLHQQSHGESFLALMKHRFRGHGLYILDEPEAALSPNRQLAMLALMHELIEDKGSQFIIATHSPILMAYPGATIYSLSESGIEKVEYEDTEHFQVTRSFLAARESFISRLFAQ